MTKGVQVPDNHMVVSQDRGTPNFIETHKKAPLIWEALNSIYPNGPYIYICTYIYICIYISLSISPKNPLENPLAVALIITCHMYFPA